METVTLKLNAKLQPIDRGECYEEPLSELMSEAKFGSVTGGGTAMIEVNGNNEVDYCDIAIELPDTSDESIKRLIDIIEDLSIPVPKGSLLQYGEGVETAIGSFEGLAIYLSGTELPDEVYEKCDVNVVVENVEELLDDNGLMLSHMDGAQDTALYFYGFSFEEMKTVITPFLNEYPLCKGCRVVQIA